MNQIVVTGTGPTSIFALYLDPHGRQRISLIKEADELKKYFPFEMKMPCGNAIKIETVEKIPLVDVPCPCGDKTHWLVKWKGQIK